MTEEIIPTNGTSAEDVVYAKKVKEIYIDGVNVAGCEFCKPNPLYKTEYTCHCRGYIQDDGLHAHLSCEHNPICYYKQLRRLEQENKELKIKLSSTKCYLCGEGFLTPEGTELYEEKEKYKTALIELRKDFNNLRFTIIPFHVGAKEVLPHKLVDVIQDYCIEIEDRIHEVLKK